MVELMDLWLAILLSGVIVFMASSVIHMLLPIHKGDVSKLPGEESLMEAIRGQDIKPGDYMYPCAGSMKDMGNPEFIERMKQGPVGFLTVLPNGPPAMNKSLGQWFAYTLLISFFVAYIATLGKLKPGSEYMDVFRLTGTVAILGYATSQVSNSIWKGSSWCTTLKFAFDGVIYGLLTAGVFSWLWPEAS